MKRKSERCEVNPVGEGEKRWGHSSTFELKEGSIKKSRIRLRILGTGSAKGAPRLHGIWWDCSHKRCEIEVEMGKGHARLVVVEVVAKRRINIFSATESGLLSHATPLLEAREVRGVLVEGFIDNGFECIESRVE